MNGLVMKLAVKNENTLVGVTKEMVGLMVDTAPDQPRNNHPEAGMAVSLLVWPAVTPFCVKFGVTVPCPVVQITNDWLVGWPSVPYTVSVSVELTSEGQGMGPTDGLFNG